MTTETKYCRKCDTHQPLSNFYPHPSNSSGVESKCKACSNKMRIQNKIKRKFGLSVEQYEEMLRDQPCGICGKERETDNNRKNFCIDHDHRRKDGKVRGVLCGACNRGLGNFADNPSLLRIAAIYLDSANQTEDCESEVSNIDIESPTVMGSFS